MYILLAGPSRLFLEGIARIVRDLDDSVLVHCVEDAGSALGVTAPDLVVIDADAVGPACDAVLGLRDEVPRTPVVVLSSVLGQDAIEALAACGATACIEKTASAQTLTQALRRVLAGGTLRPAPLQVFALGRDGHLADTPRPHTAAPRETEVHLTPRQREILALVARGESNKVIARQLDIAEATVKIHLTAIYKTLGVSNRGKAANMARRMPQMQDEDAVV